MKMVGHETEAIYRRYAIADEAMLREGAAKLEALLEAQRGAFRVVVPLRNDNVSTKSAGIETVREGLSVAEITERIRSQVVGRDGIEPPTPGFSVLGVDRLPSLPFQRLACWRTRADRHDTLRPITPCYAE